MPVHFHCPHRVSHAPFIRFAWQLEILEDRTVPAVVDLTTVGSLATVNGLAFLQADPQPTGVGVIRDFLRVQSNSGSNTVTTQTRRPVQLDEKKDHHTRAMKLSELPGGYHWRALLPHHFLGVNQDQNQPLISLEAARLYVSDSPKEAGYNAVTKQLGSMTSPLRPRERIG